MGLQPTHGHKWQHKRLTVRLHLLSRPLAKSGPGSLNSRNRIYLRVPVCRFILGLGLYRGITLWKSIDTARKLLPYRLSSRLPIWGSLYIPLPRFGRNIISTAYLTGLRLISSIALADLKSKKENMRVIDFDQNSAHMPSVKLFYSELLGLLGLL